MSHPDRLVRLPRISRIRGDDITQVLVCKRGDRRLHSRNFGQLVFVDDYIVQYTIEVGNRPITY